MVEFAPCSPLTDALSLQRGDVTLHEVPLARITSITPFRDREADCSKALSVAHGLKLPATGRIITKGGQSLRWVGRGVYFLMGDKAAAKSIAKVAALTDQSDGWVVLRLEGDDARAVMARLCPLDLRAATFKNGHVARSEVAHMMAVVSGNKSGFELMFMRSFARTAAQHIKDAMESVAAQSA